MLGKLVFEKKRWCDRESGGKVGSESRESGGNYGVDRDYTSLATNVAERLGAWTGYYVSAIAAH